MVAKEIWKPSDSISLVAKSLCIFPKPLISDVVY
jgi:hypothetical protein